MGNQVAQVTPAQSDKVTTINEATTQLDNLISEELDLTVTVDFLLTDDQQNNNLSFNLTGTPVGAFTMALQARSKLFMVRNGTGQTATVEVDPGGDGADGRTVDVADAEFVILFSDGANIDLIAAGGGGGDFNALDWKQSVRAATTANITLSNLQTVDGVSLAAGNRVLVKNQTTASENGIYSVVDGGAWTRAEDFDADSEVTTGATTFVEEGTDNGGEIWILTTTGAIIVGTTNLTFTELAAGGAAAVPIQDEGVQIVAAPTAIDFRGPNVAVTDESGVARVTISEPTVPANALSFIIAAGDETTAITVGAGKVSFRAPYAFTIAEVRASLVTASTSGVVTVDINEGGVSILGANKLSIDQDETTSVTAATPADLSDTAIADDAVLTIDVDAAGTGAAGLKVTIITTAVGSGGGGNGDSPFPPFSPPLAATFSTEVVSGTLDTLNSTTDSASRGLLMAADGSSGNNVLARYTSWTKAVATFICRVVNSTRPGFESQVGFTIGSTTGRGTSVVLQNERVRVYRHQDNTSDVSQFNISSFGYDAWFRVETTLTDITISVSRDGENWHQFYTEAFSAHVEAAGGTSDRYGFLIWSENGAEGRMTVPFFSDDGTNI